MFNPLPDLGQTRITQRVTRLLERHVIHSEDLEGILANHDSGKRNWAGIHIAVVPLHRKHLSLVAWLVRRKCTLESVLLHYRSCHLWLPQDFRYLNALSPDLPLFVCKVYTLHVRKFGSFNPPHLYSLNFIYWSPIILPVSMIILEAESEQSMHPLTKRRRGS